MFNKGLFNGIIFNGGRVDQEEGKTTMNFTTAEKDKANWNELARSLAMVFTGIEKDKAVLDEKRKQFSMVMSFEPFSMRQDTIVEGISKIKRPAQGQISITAE